MQRGYLETIFGHTIWRVVKPNMKNIAFSAAYAVGDSLHCLHSTRAWLSFRITYAGHLQDDPLIEFCIDKPTACGPKEQQLGSATNHTNRNGEIMFDWCFMLEIYQFYT